MKKRVLVLITLMGMVLTQANAADPLSAAQSSMNAITSQFATAQGGVPAASKQTDDSQLDKNAGLASVTAMNQGNGIEDKAGSQFSNKVINDDFVPQLNKLQVFGANLFSSQCQNLPQMALYNPNYLLSIGDKISITLWGAFEYSAVAEVDSQGNIFIPKVGPVHVADIPNKDLNKVIGDAIKRTFEKNVTVYANLMSAQPVQIFVSGYVSKPGLYDGMSSDSVLYFLCKAGGIEPDKGSFRHIDLIRNGKVISHIDLYNFLVDGVIPFSQLQQGDSIVVRQKAASVTVIGQVKSPAMYEPKDGQFDLPGLLRLVGVLPEATYVLIEDNRGLNPTNKYIPLSAIGDQVVKGGEQVTLTSDQNIKQITVSVTGAILGPHQFVVPIGTTLEDVVEKLKFRSNANIDDLQLFRKSVAAAQKAAIDASLNYLEQQAYTKSALTKDGLIMQQQYAGLVSTFVEKAKKVQPKGQVIVGSKTKWEHIALQNNDVINIPNQNQVVTISGQVMAPMAINYNEKFSVKDYINAVGGYTPSAETGYVLLLHENGTAERVDTGMFTSWMSYTTAVKGGDQIIVPNEGMSEALPIMATISQIVFQIAFAARVFIAPV
ncbi:polysaccharide biosynthesis/export family protein [Francisella philomiragia]|uniref:polysaccharide biosynthesis/export family protein n=3 Tax=Francisella philomiragia TaxID=28110 RepID=UPI0005A57869|nr:polysaccharide biosynthesis/export family protein [Francisella philomiragia]AJI56075.1 polysaccharide biosynthesis/export family protein [Francisella philomiragia]